MSQNVQYDFCPRCGALMHGGVCQSCEFNANANNNMNMNADIGINNNANMYAGNGYNPYQNNIPYQNPAGMGMPLAEVPKKKNTGLIIGIIIGGIVLLLIIAVVAIFGISAIIKSVSETAKENIEESYNYDYDDDYNFDYNYDFDYEDNLIEEPDIWDDIPDAFDDEESSDVESDDELLDIDGDGIGELEYDSGLEGLNAEYYPVITDYIRHDLSYSVTFMEYVDDEDRVSCFYPYLQGSQSFIPYFNQAFYMIAEGAEELADEYECQASSIAYVTYMDEEILSVVFIEVYSFDDGSTYEDILCYNFDMINGELFDFELLDISDEFLAELEKRCLEQSTSDAVYLFEEYTKDELRDILTDEDYSLVAFYTPIGMEIGISYDGYWCCATFKDYDKYISTVAEEATEF